jgi:hypothetical protein
LARKKPDDALRCSFCHKSQDVVEKLISSPSDYPRSYICDECVAVCNSILQEGKAAAGGMGYGERVPPRTPDEAAALEAERKAAHAHIDQLSPDELTAVRALLDAVTEPRVFPGANKPCIQACFQILEIAAEPRPHRRTAREATE